jgi:hypothetical protein
MLFLSFDNLEDHLTECRNLVRYTLLILSHPFLLARGCEDLRYLCCGLMLAALAAFDSRLVPIAEAARRNHPVAHRLRNIDKCQRLQREGAHSLGTILLLKLQLRRSLEPVLHGLEVHHLKLVPRIINSRFHTHLTMRW